ncbi:MAG: hypothetical protein ACR2QF_11265 [Geminicoccaceae bacterium]
MQILLREVEVAYLLGYREMSDFRTAVKNGDVPAPTRQLKSGRRVVDGWSRSLLEEWATNQEQAKGSKSALTAAIDRLAG